MQTKNTIGRRIRRAGEREQKMKAGYIGGGRYRGWKPGRRQAEEKERRATSGLQSSSSPRSGISPRPTQLSEGVTSCDRQSSCQPADHVEFLEFSVRSYRTRFALPGQQSWPMTGVSQPAAPSWLSSHLARRREQSSTHQGARTGPDPVTKPNVLGKGIRLTVGTMSLLQSIHPSSHSSRLFFPSPHHPPFLSVFCVLSCKGCATDTRPGQIETLVL